MVYKLDNGAVDCHIITSFVRREDILKIEDVVLYFGDDIDDMASIVVLEIPEADTIPINFEGKLIRHTAAEWQAIYASKQGILCASEY